ncbi:MAG TPA: PIN domain-containing protein [Armatimonadota bacterium]|jgi:predicted nucleic acid-binding protein
MRVFLDATCWVAAAGSPSGGSAELLRLARANAFRIITTPLVLVEAERNILAKLPREAMSRFLVDVHQTDIEVGVETSQHDIARWIHLVAQKDAHVLAGAYLTGSDVLVSLDRRHILTSAVREGFPILVQDTHEFFAALKAGR